MGKDKTKRGRARMTRLSQELADEQLAEVSGGAGGGINHLVSVSQLNAGAAAEQASDAATQEDQKLNRSRRHR